MIILFDKLFHRFHFHWRKEESFERKVEASKAENEKVKKNDKTKKEKK